MSPLRAFAVILTLIMSLTAPAQAEDLWVKSGAGGQKEIQLYFFWSQGCQHCSAAHPHISAIPRERPWVRLHELEVSGNAENLGRFEQMAREVGGEAVAVPSFIFCGEMHSGWDSPEGVGAELLRRLDACRARAEKGETLSARSQDTGERIDIPLLGGVDARSLSLPALTIALGLLDAFNPCAFFVLLFLLSMMVHQKSRTRMALIGGVFVLVSGLMYFAFMAAWLNVFQILGHLGWVTLAAGVLAVAVGAVNVKDFFWFEKGVSLSIPESKKPDIFRRARGILAADQLAAMLFATTFLAIAANFYELLCTAGFPMVYTRLLTLEEPSVASRYGYLAAYNLIYITPLAVIVAVFTRTLGARKLTEREGRLLKLMSGLMMLELGVLLLVAPDRVGQGGVAFALVALAVGATWLAARLTRQPS